MDNWLVFGASPIQSISVFSIQNLHFDKENWKVEGMNNVTLTITNILMIQTALR